ncbi:MAG: Stp1/IreP family PP2C-type Ser/Thr phosphatase [Oscillospiraceae bacterium]
MKLAGKTDIGNQRHENQDNYRAGREQNDTVWAVVCDGMGGARGGKLASNLAAAHIENIYSSEIKAVDTSEKLREFILSTISSANALVYNTALKDSAMRGMGTTLVCAVVQNNYLHYANVGDSRLYLYRDNELIQLTRDHSMVQELVEQGSITESEAFVHPHKNLITRALGVQSEVEIDYAEIEVHDGEELILCSDGLSNYVSLMDMSAIVKNCDFFEQCEQLVSKALNAGGQDNITAVLIGIEQQDAFTEDKNG